MKLTIHDACWDAQASEWSNRAIAAGVRWLKVVDDPARAYGVAVAAPACGVIYRKVAPKDIEALTDLRRHPEFSDAQACAEMFVRLADVRTAPNLWVEGANEVKLSGLSDAQWYGKVCTALIYAVMIALLLFPDMPEPLAAGGVFTCVFMVLMCLVMYLADYARVLRGEKR